MFEFINWLRILAAVLITNSHYGEIWPISALAAGGMLGNVIFFAVSGFCLCKVKGNFPRWYLRRFLRVWPVMIAFTAFTVLIGKYPIGCVDDFVRLFVYPTNYVFLVWLLVLYVAFYPIACGAKKNPRLPVLALGALTAVWIATYVFFVDKTAYVVDNVNSPFIMFLYFAAMLVGAIIKLNADKLTGRKRLTAVLAVVSVASYFATKLAVSKFEALACVQIINQFVILAALFLIFTVFLQLEERLSRLPVRVRRVTSFLSGLTLDVYLVQFVIIKQFEAMVFPLNFLLVTALIPVAAIILRLAELGTKQIFARIRGEKCKS